VAGGIGRAGDAPAPCASEIAFPATGWPVPSRSVTVIVEVVELSASSDVDDALTDDTVGETGPTPKLTPAVWVSVVESVVSVAL
jgi:hypothetical protein